MLTRSVKKVKKAARVLGRSLGTEGGLRTVTKESTDRSSPAGLRKFTKGVTRSHLNKIAKFGNGHKLRVFLLFGP